MGFDVETILVSDLFPIVKLDAPVLVKGTKSSTGYLQISLPSRAETLNPVFRSRLRGLNNSITMSNEFQIVGGNPSAPIITCC
jgi:hypothetical protein